MKKLRRISTELIDKNPYWEYRFDKYELPNGKEGDYHYVNSRGSTMVIPQKDDATFLLIKQYRYLNGKISLEFPGGGLKGGITPEENALEELSEETGMSAKELIFLGEYNPCNGLTNEICKIFLARGLKPCQKKGDESEEIETIEIKFNDIINKIKTGEIWDGMTLAAWSLFYFSELNGEK